MISATTPQSRGFKNSYTVAYANLVGTVPSVSDQFNYKVSSANPGYPAGRRGSDQPPFQIQRI